MKMSMGRSVQQAAANEIAFRRANEGIDRTRKRLELQGERTAYLCECEEESCTDILLLSLEDYRNARSTPRRFVVAAGHQSDRDVVLARGDGFVLIEKTGEEGELVERADPRA
jgi:hypothetical protein